MSEYGAWSNNGPDEGDRQKSSDEGAVPGSVAGGSADDGGVTQVWGQPPDGAPGWGGAPDGSSVAGGAAVPGPHSWGTPAWGEGTGSGAAQPGEWGTGQSVPPGQSPAEGQAAASGQPWGAHGGWEPGHAGTWGATPGGGSGGYAGGPTSPGPATPGPATYGPGPATPGPGYGSGHASGTSPAGGLPYARDTLPRYEGGGYGGGAGNANGWGDGSPYGAGPYSGSYKGARLGLPAYGPGSLASQWRRLGARIIDNIIFGVLGTVIFVAAEWSRLQHIFHLVQQSPNGQLSSAATSAILALEGTSLLLIALLLVLEIAWEAMATWRWGRTPGKALLGLRALHVRGNYADPARLTPAQSWGRAAGYFGAIGIGGLVVPFLGLVDAIWCLWDKDRQCLHDKIAGTVVINDWPGGRPPEQSHSWG